jgi:hypothetical protein
MIGVTGIKLKQGLPHYCLSVNGSPFELSTASHDFNRLSDVHTIRGAIQEFEKLAKRYSDEVHYRKFVVYLRQLLREKMHPEERPVKGDIWYDTMGRLCFLSKPNSTRFRVILSVEGYQRRVNEPIGELYKGIRYCTSIIENPKGVYGEFEGRVEMETTLREFLRYILTVRKEMREEPGEFTLDSIAEVW